MKYNRQSRNALKNYFPLPNEIFSLGLYSGEISVYAYLMCLEDRKTFKCHPSYKTIGRALKMSRNTVRKYVKSLEDKQLIFIEPTMISLKSGKKQNGNLLYTIRPIKEAVDYFNVQQLRKVELEAEKLNAIRKLEKYDRKHGISGTSRSSLFEAG